MTVTYDEHRDSEQLRLLEESAIKVFIDQCKKSADSSSAGRRQTVFFFPGGMASQLTRAKKKFDASSPGKYEYDPIWVVPRTFLGGALELAMHRDATGTFRDKGDRFIIADAPLAIDKLTPHDGLIRWCAERSIGLCVFPWDWRRRMEDTVKLFVGKFLPLFQERVKKAGCPDPLESFALVGHSAGGMIANLILRSDDRNLANMTHVITVGTPFYGYAGQLHRWFEGVRLLNLFELLKQPMMETIASFPGPYVYHFLDEETFTNSTNLGAFASDDDFPLADYPSIDAVNEHLRADAYNPQTDGSRIRYPARTGFNRSELEYAKKQFQQLASPMNPILLEKFYNIRGVRTEPNGKPVDNTVGSLTWDWILENFDARDESPIYNKPSLVPGDDTQPAWTARLATNMDRCVTVKDRDIEHLCLMNHKSVLMAIQGILRPKEADMSVPEMPRQPEPASDQEMVKFIRWIVGQWITGDAPQELLDRPFDDKKVLIRVSEEFSRDRFLAIAHRLLSEVMRGMEPAGPERTEAGAGAREQARPKDGAPRARGRQSAVRKASSKRRQRNSQKKKP